MSSHTLAKAQADLPVLVERALRGEPVVITRDDAAAVSLHPVAAPAKPPTEPGPLTDEDLDWLERHRVHRATPPAIDSATLVRRMRDGEW